MLCHTNSNLWRAVPHSLQLIMQLHSRCLADLTNASVARWQRSVLFVSWDSNTPTQNKATLAPQLGLSSAGQHLGQGLSGEPDTFPALLCRQRLPLFVSQDGPQPTQDVVNLAHSLGQQGV